MSTGTGGGGSSYGSPGGGGINHGKRETLKAGRKARTNNAKMRAIEKLGGKSKASEILEEWNKLSWAEGVSAKNKSECDGFLKTHIILGLNQNEMRSFFNIGYFRYRRLLEYDPTKPVPHIQPNNPNFVTKEQLEYLRVFLTTQVKMEPGLPCAHRSVPLYFEDPAMTFIKLHKSYEEMAIADHCKPLKYNRFREYVRWMLPALKLGKTETDKCNTCFSIELEIHDPSISETRKQDLILAKRVHLDEALGQRRVVTKIVNKLKESLGPDDPPVPEPVANLSIKADPFYRVKKPFVIASQGQQSGDLSEEESEKINHTEEEESEKINQNEEEENEKINHTEEHVSGENSSENSHELDPKRFKYDEDLRDQEGEDVTHAGDENKKSMKCLEEGDMFTDEDGLERIFVREESKSKGEENLAVREASESKVPDNLLDENDEVEDIPLLTDKEDEDPGLEKVTFRKVRITVEDYGQGRPLPSYFAMAPNKDYFNSNLSLYNMNYVDPVTQMADIYYYDERVGGKGGNETCSLRWHDETKMFRDLKNNKIAFPAHKIKVLDNCTGQNKSNQTMMFDCMTQLLLYPDGTLTLVYFMPGHSHNISDRKTADAVAAIRKKNLFTPWQIAAEVNKVNKIRAHVVPARNQVFLDWKDILAKYFNKLPSGFTSYYMFEFSQGKVKMMRYGDVGILHNEVKEVTLCSNPGLTRKLIIQEVFGLKEGCDIGDIVEANPKLLPLPARLLSQTKVDSIKEKYQMIPMMYRPYYPEGVSSLSYEQHSELVQKGRNRELLSESPLAGPMNPSPVSKPAVKPVGRPPKSKGPLPGQRSVASMFILQSIGKVKESEKVNDPDDPKEIVVERETRDRSREENMDETSEDVIVLEDDDKSYAESDSKDDGKSLKINIKKTGGQFFIQ